MVAVLSLVDILRSLVEGLSASLGLSDLTGFVMWKGVCRVRRKAMWWFEGFFQCLKSENVCLYRRCPGDVQRLAVAFTFESQSRTRHVQSFNY